MKEQQQSNLNGRKEIGKLEMTKEVVYTLNGMGILALFAFGFFSCHGIHYLPGTLTLITRAKQFLFQ